MPQSNQCYEYFDIEFKDHRLEHDIVSHLTILEISLPNCVMERKNKPLLGMLKSMMSYTSLSMSFYGYTLDTKMYLLKVIPSKFVHMTPMKL